MVCCSHCEGLEREFDRATARGDLRRYRRRGPLPSTRRLLRALRAEGVIDRTVLDIGGGVGAVYHELLADGARAAFHVDASSAYLEAAEAEARRRGHADRVTLRHGDFVDVAPLVPSADIVVLDRVICCYPDMESLVSLSARKARRLYGLVYPREKWWLRVGLPLINLYFRARRCPFRVYLHPPAAVDATVRAEGLEPVFHGSTIMWRVELYARG